jgi:hypothetical protein
MEELSGGASIEDRYNLSIVLGGPLHQLYCHIRVSGSTLELVHRRMLAVSLLAWLPLPARTKRAGLREYGTLALCYVHDFYQKWLRGKRPVEETLVGSADIQSLADLSNSYQVVIGMQLVPVTRSTLLLIAVVTALPIAPLLLTMISFDELLNRLRKMVF